jgi:hypothetical protein
MPAPPAVTQPSIWNDAGTWKFAAGVAIGYVVRSLTAKLKTLKVRC